MPQTVTLIPGDSVGPEVAAATCRLIEAAGVDIHWERVLAGSEALAAGQEAMPQASIDSIRRNGVALKGRIATPIGTGFESANVRLRKELGLFASVRPIQHLDGLPSRYEGVDIVIIRESTEDVYSGIEHTVHPGVVQGLKVTTRVACERVVRFAFDYARRRGRKSVHLVHKANIMKRSDGLFLAVGHELSKSYEDIDFHTIIADNACMQLVKNPTRFDVMVCQNLFGDLISDLGAGLVGGISAVWGESRDGADVHVFEAIHGFAPALDGKGVANPLPFIRPAMALLRHLGDNGVANHIEAAIGATLNAGTRTADLGGTATTEGLVDAVIAEL
jgi:isocitrate dehydrogenase (NAD+)